MNILFVCRGNVARSQMAESLFNKYKEGDYVLSSAGTKLSKPDKKTLESLLPGTEHVIESMKEGGIDMSNFKRKTVNKDMTQEADKIILIVDDNDPVPDYITNNNKTVRWDVPDPKGKSLDFTRNVRDIIKDKILKFEI